MGLFNNKDKSANNDSAFNPNNPPGDQLNTNTYPDQRFDDSRDPNVNDDSFRNDRAYNDDNNNKNNLASQNNNVPDQRSGTNALGHQYQDPNADDPRRQGVTAQGANQNQNFDSRYGTNTDANSGGQNFTSGPGNAAGYSAPDQAGVHPYDNNANAQGYAGAGPGAQQGPGNFAGAGAGAAAGGAGYADQQGIAATGGGRGGAAAGYNPTGQVLGYNQAGQSAALPPKSVIRKDEWLGKLENAAGVLLSSEGMKQRGAAKEMEAVRLKKQSAELGNARGLEQEAVNRRERAVGYGAHPVHQGLGAGNPTGGPTGGVSGAGMGRGGNGLM